MSKQKLQAVLDKYSKEDLARMIADLTDGQRDYDIHAMTGLPMDRCTQIANASAEIIVALYL